MGAVLGGFFLASFLASQMMYSCLAPIAPKTSAAPEANVQSWYSQQRFQVSRLRFRVYITIEASVRTAPAIQLSAAISLVFLAMNSGVFIILVFNMD